MIEFDKKAFIGENENGYEFYLSENLTKYAKLKELKDMAVVYVQKKGEKNFEAIVLLEKNNPIYETRSIERMATHIDILTLAKEFSDD